MPSKPGLVVLVSYELTVSFSVTGSKAHDTATAHTFPALAPDISEISRLSPLGGFRWKYVWSGVGGITDWKCRGIKKTPSSLRVTHKYIRQRGAGCELPYCLSAVHLTNYSS